LPCAEGTQLRAAKPPLANCLASAFKVEIARALGTDELLQGIVEWLALLHYLARTAERHPGLVIVLDEFPYLADADPALPSTLQKFWDSGAPRTGNLKRLLCGSMISHMEELLAERNPLYGRKTLALDLAPLSFRDASQFVARCKAEDKLVTAGVFGGIPFYLQLLDQGATLQNNIIRLLLTQTGSLVDEPVVLLQSELREVSKYALMHVLPPESPPPQGYGCAFGDRPSRSPS
jgi:AAA+ ATPase superfamily predicted ATPase